MITAIFLAGVTSIFFIDLNMLFSDKFFLFRGDVYGGRL